MRRAKCGKHEDVGRKFSSGGSRKGRFDMVLSNECNY